MSHAALVLAVFAVFSKSVSSETICEFLPPLDGTQGVDYGLITIPGANIPGEAYKPLAEVIQASFPGRMWVGVTELWFIDYPNQFEIQEAIDQCLQAATNGGFNTSSTFLYGHSQGGIILSEFIRNNPGVAKGIVLYGSWLYDDNYPDTTFPVPVLTAIGTLDGAGVPNIMPEIDDAAEANAINPGGEVTWAIDQVNHAQVASGPIPDVVIRQDIPAERSNEEAHQLYADAAVSWIVHQFPNEFDQGIVDMQQAVFDTYQAFTDGFMAPFYEMRALEANQPRTNSPWIEQGQQVILGLTPDESAYADDYLTVTDIMYATIDEVKFAKPSIDNVEDCEAQVGTASYIESSLTPINTASLTSVDTLKAKFKLEDVVKEGLCFFNPRERSQCKDVNQAAIDRALAAADDISRNRYLSQGRQLVPIDDMPTCCESGWANSGGLTYTEVNDSTWTIQSVSLITEENIPDLIAAVHYCDILSPFRALEWIYVTGVVHG